MMIRVCGEMLTVCRRTATARTIDRLVFVMLIVRVVVVVIVFIVATTHAFSSQPSPQSQP